ncbi:peptidase S24-like protein [Paraburkholderia sp. BL8N3]|nr:S24 family peptidase [Paraburkholderia sp. BL8N3]TCK43451.1 peptidase S24-like protein [Paraburkholderia sp. BL8N3]
MKFHTWLAGALARAGKNQTELAEYLEVTPQAVSLWLQPPPPEGKGTVPRGRRLVAIAEFVGDRTILPGYASSIPSDQGNVLPWSSRDELPDDPERVWIDRYDYHFSAGDGLIQWEVREKNALPFNRAFFNAKGVKPENAKLLVSRGDSMEPYLFDKDMFMIDSSDQRVRDGEIYAIFYEDEPLVKQVFKLPGGGITLHSYNERKYRDREITADKMHYVKIVGRVVYRSG